MANGAYGFSWYSISPLQVQKDFILIALISQKGVKIKAKIYEVTLDTFGQVFLNVVIRIFQGLVFFSLQFMNSAYAYMSILLSIVK